MRRAPTAAGDRTVSPRSAAAIFAPLSSKSVVARNPRSQRVARKGRVPSAAIIMFVSFETAQCSLYVLVCQDSLYCVVQALESARLFD
jgi:hypothetical protein